MRHIVIYIFIFLLCTQGIEAKNMANMFLTMPDTLMPYIAKEQRVDLINMKNIDPSTPAKLSTIFKNDIEINTLSDSRIEFTVGKLHYDIVRLSGKETDSLYCMLCTVPTPLQETTCTVYDKDWKLLYHLDFEKEIKNALNKNKNDICAFEKMELPIIKVELNNDDISLDVEIKDGLPLKDSDSDKYAAVLQRKLKWNGESFKEY